MMFAHIDNGAILETYESLSALKAAFPSAIFPWPLSNEELAPLDLALIAAEPEPDGLAPGEYTELGDPVMVGGECIRPRIVVPVTPERLAKHETALHGVIDQAAGAFRARFITDVPGQSQTYAEKESEALAYASDPGGSYPFLQAEASATGATIAAVAADVSDTASAWRLLGAAIEGARIGAKRAVTTAKDAEDWAAMDAAAIVDWEALLA